MINLLTKSPFSIIEIIKNQIRPQRGPEAVLCSLLTGLQELGIKYNLNPKKLNSETVAVLQNVNALRYAIEQKKQKKIKYLLAGPNIVVTPKEAGAIYEYSLIDKIIVPSNWVKNFYSFLSPIIKDKIYIWPAGVDDPGESAPLTERDTILIYQKNTSDEILNKIIQKIKVYPIKFANGGSEQFNRVKIDIIKYGKYKQADYFTKLKKTKLAIFLTQSESQGIAQQEAWMRDVPTLVWNPGNWQYNEYMWQDIKISSPYLTDTCGEFFTSIEEFDIKLIKILSNLSAYTPRQYALNNFTHKKSAQNFLTIIDSVSSTE